MSTFASSSWLDSTAASQPAAPRFSSMRGCHTTRLLTLRKQLSGQPKYSLVLASSGKLNANYVRAREGAAALARCLIMFHLFKEDFHQAGGAPTPVENVMRPEALLGFNPRGNNICPLFWNAIHQAYATRRRLFLEGVIYLITTGSCRNGELLANLIRICVWRELPEWNSH